MSTEIYINFKKTIKNDEHQILKSCYFLVTEAMHSGRDTQGNSTILGVLSLKPSGGYTNVSSTICSQQCLFF